MSIQDLIVLLLDYQSKGKTEINFADGNFGGRGDDLTSSRLVTNEYDRTEILINPPYAGDLDF